MFLLLLLLVVVEERLRALRGEVRREGARALAALGAAGPPPNGGNGVTRGTTRRRHTANQLLMLQNPHRSQPEVHRVAYKTWRRADWREKTRPARPLQPHFREKTRPTQPLQPHFREKTRPTSVKTPIVGCFERAGRTFSRKRHDKMAALKPPSPLLAPKQRPLKPPSPLQPKNAPKTPISHPQRRRRFQPRLGRRPQRRRRFQTTGPAGRQGQTAVPMGGGRAWPGDQWAANVTNVVKPTRFKSPRENPCYKRRQSKPKNHDFQRKSPRIDDVRNNTHPSTPKTQHARPPMTPTGSGGPDCGAHGQRRHHRHPNVARDLSRSFFETPQKRCNSNDTNSMLEQAAGELRAKLMGRRGLTGLRDDAPSRRLAARTARGRAAAHGHTKQPGPTGVEGAGGTGGHGRASRRGAERSEALASRAAGPSGARNTSGATSNTITRAGRRPRRSPAPLGARNTRGATSNTRKQERRHHRHNQGKQKPQIPKDLRFHRARGGS